MTITVKERWDSRAAQSGLRPTVELRFTVRGTDNDVDAHAELEAQAPLIYRGLVRQDTSIERIAEDAWLGIAVYSPIEPLEVGSVVLEFDTGGGSVHITQSLSTVASYALPGETAPDFKGAINATKDSVDGVDIDAPAMKATCRIALLPEDYSDSYVATLSYLAKKVNNAPFKGWAAGEVRFDAGVVTKNGSDKVEIMLSFLISPNATGLTVGEITGIDKDGWDYLWVLYEDSVDADAHWLPKQPVAVYVERVYDRADFSALGIGA